MAKPPVERRPKTEETVATQKRYGRQARVHVTKALLKPLPFMRLDSGESRGLGSAIDPVCGRAAREGALIASEHYNRIYCFCDAGCKQRFDADPERYILLPVEALVSMLANRHSLR